MYIYLYVTISPSAAFYYTLANISPQHRSSLNMIQLVTLVKAVDVATYGIDKILEPFMKDLEELEKVCVSLLHSQLHAVECCQGACPLSPPCIAIPHSTPLFSLRRLDITKANHCHG